MATRTSPDSAAAAQARIEAELARQAAQRAAEKAAEEAAEKAAEKVAAETEHHAPESHHLDAEVAKFRGRQSESTFDSAGGNRRTASTSVRANVGGRTETARRRTTTAQGGTAE